MCLRCCGHPQDICGFTSMSKEVAPHLVMEYLNELFSKFDELCDVYSVYKVSAPPVAHEPHAADHMQQRICYSLLHARQARLASTIRCDKKQRAAL